MSVVVVTPPVHGISLTTVKAHLRVDHSDDDTLITAYLNAAVGHIDGPSGWLDRSVWPQTLELRQDTLCGPIRLPYGPVSDVASVKYVDSAGVEQTLVDAGYVLLANDYVDLAYGASWPSHRGDAEGVRVEYEAGYETLPPAILSAVLLMVGDMYSFRETAVTGTISADVQMSTTVQALLSPFRNWRV